MKLLENFLSFGGHQQLWQHDSKTLNCTINFAVYLPPQAIDKDNPQACPVLYWLSGLTCNECNFIEKSGFQRYAAEHGLIVVAPDTSPRGVDLDDGSKVADDEEFDLGQGAGFYVNATQAPWAKNYQMYDYVVDELPELIENNFNTTGKKSVFGHSMGGHGALVVAMRNAEKYESVSVFAPIASATRSDFGQKALSAYLGADQSSWQEYDAVELMKNLDSFMPILIDQGMDDRILADLKPEMIETIGNEKNIEVTLNRREGYGHSYYFVASFMGEHIAYHAEKLG